MCTTIHNLFYPIKIMSFEYNTRPNITHTMNSIQATIYSREYPSNLFIVYRKKRTDNNIIIFESTVLFRFGYVIHIQ